MNISLKIKVYATFIILFLICMITYSYKNQDKPLSDKSNLTEVLVPVAHFNNIDLDLKNSDMHSLQNKNLYYIKKDWDSENEILESTLYCYDTETGKEFVKFSGNKVENEFIQTFVVDRMGNYYIFGEKQGKERTTFYLDKYNEMETKIYRRDWVEEDISQAEGEHIAGGVATDDGEVYFYTSTGTVFFCDRNGKLKSKKTFKIKNVGGMVIGAQKEVYLYFYEEQNIIFYSIDIERNEKQIEKNRGVFNTKNAIVEVYSGYEDGIYLKDRNYLWTYNPNNGEKKAALEWNHPYINIDGMNIRQVFKLENGNYFILLWDLVYESKEQAEIVFTSKDKLRDRQEIVLGIVGKNYDYRLTEMVKQFNKQSLEWEVKIETYGGTNQLNREKIEEEIMQLNQAFLNGEGPDLIDISNISAEEWVTMGRLENLEVYFDKSDVVGRQDILESVWKAGYINGKMIGIIPAFSINTLISKIPEQESGWLVNEAINMEEGENWDYLVKQGIQVRNFELLVESNYDSFVNYEEKQCYFDKPEFILLLEEIKNLNYSEGILEEITDNPLETFINDNYLTQQIIIDSMQDFLYAKTVCNRKISWVGYPSMDGKPRHFFHAFSQIGISSTSKKKEGAWAFLEFILSEKAQEWSDESILNQGPFPVRKDAFAEYLSSSYYQYGDNIFPQFVAEEEDFQEVNQIVENIRLKTNITYHYPLSIIIWEEWQAFNYGEKTAEETAETIQKRVQLYLDES